ncbi:hypothetical protein [Campylobacter sp. RM9328]|uniref:hypothetical protein n=1 Tax=Campylobacter sp. RM9328 TaxID=1705720 RepID=UPI00147444D7|nr:hypothetical protein [Campylobacter sp. RM9328]
MSFFPPSLNGQYRTYFDNDPVLHTINKRVYYVNSSFFLLNSNNSYIICYVLSDAEYGTLLVCPSVYVTDLEPDTVIPEYNPRGGDSVISS